MDFSSIEDLLDISSLDGSSAELLQPLSAAAKTVVANSDAVIIFLIGSVWQGNHYVPREKFLTKYEQLLRGATETHTSPHNTTFDLLRLT